MGSCNSYTGIFFAPHTLLHKNKSNNLYYFIYFENLFYCVLMNKQFYAKNLKEWL